MNGHEEPLPFYGDVLFTREAPAGEGCLVPRELKVCMGQRMVMLRPKTEKVDPVFYLLSWPLRNASLIFQGYQ